MLDVRIEAARQRLVNALLALPPLGFAPGETKASSPWPRACAFLESIAVSPWVLFSPATFGSTSPALLHSDALKLAWRWTWPRTPCLPQAWTRSSSPRETCRERFGDYPPYNMDGPNEHLKRVKEALEKDEPMPSPDLEPGIGICPPGSSHRHRRWGNTSRPYSRIAFNRASLASE